MAYNPDAEGWYEAHELVCAGCKAHADLGKDHKEPTPGGKVYVTDTRPPELQLRTWAPTSNAAATT